MRRALNTPLNLGTSTEVLLTDFEVHIARDVLGVISLESSSYSYLLQGQNGFQARVSFNLADLPPAQKAALIADLKAAALWALKHAEFTGVIGPGTDDTTDDGA